MSRLLFALLLLFLLVLLFYYVRAMPPAGDAPVPTPAAVPVPWNAPSPGLAVIHRALQTYVAGLLHRFTRRIELQHLRQQNDPQNVHDTAVVSHIAAKYKRLVALTDPEMIPEWRDHFPELLEATRGEILAEFKKAPPPSDAADDERHSDEGPPPPAPPEAVLERVLSRFSIENTIVSLEGASDAEVLVRVWHRINHPANTPKRPDLARTLHLQLLDLLEEGEVVCVTGRVSRLITVFTLVDADDELAQPEKDSRLYLQIILGRTSRLLEELFDTEEFRSYKDRDELPPAVCTELKRRVEEVLRAEYGNLKAPLLDTCVGEAVRGIV